MPNESSKPSGARHPFRVASVSFFNSRPLIEGLDDDPAIELTRHVPSALADEIISGRADVALLPVIDYARLGGLVIVPSAGIGCDGPTLTVRIFSKTPIESIRRLACDVDSHTSVALARVVLAERFGITPVIEDFSAAAHLGDDSGARLLIGDKVVCEEPVGFPHQLDLGAAWKELTGRPFLFAVWCGREHTDLRELPELLERAKRRGLAHVDELVTRFATPRGWPEDVARRYLTEYLKFDVGPRELDAAEHFLDLAAKHDLISSPAPRLRIYQPLTTDH